MTTAAVVDLDGRRKKRFSDFAAEPEILDGDKIPIERILNREIEVIGHRIAKSKYQKNSSGQCLTLQIVLDGERRVVFTGSDVLIEQLRRYGDQVPFVATIRKVDKYYTLS